MYRILNLGKQIQNQGPDTGGAATPATYGCPWSPPAGTDGEAAFPVVVDPTLNCMKDARGNTICSDGSKYPPGCPKTPPPEVFSPGITPDVTKNGMIEGQIPPPRGGSAPAAAAPVGGAAVSPSSGPSPVLMVGAGALGAGVLAAAAYFLFLK